MADLDDFFAKKDRKKAKNIKKYSTADEIAKKLEDTNKKSDKSVKKSSSNQDGDDSRQDNHEQDEWKDFEEEKKDYTGLKIGHLNISAEANQATQGDQTGDGSGQGDGGSDSGSTSGDANTNSNEQGQAKGPWKRVQSHAPQQEKTEPVPVSQPVANEPPKSGGYIAPALRGNRSTPSSQGGSGPQGPSRLRGNKTAPDIHNEEFFPTLSGSKAPDAPNAWGRKVKNEGSFEEVRHNKASFGRQAEQRNQGSSQGVKLNLGNRYNTLSSTNDS